jgi:hypothetical protein
VCANVVGHEELTFNVEHGQRQSILLNLDGFAWRHFG